MTHYTPEEIALAEFIADELEKCGCLHGDWRDAYRAAITAIHATTERAAKYAAAQPCDAVREDIAASLRANHHLKDRPDAG